MFHARRLLVVVGTAAMLVVAACGGAAPAAAGDAPAAVRGVLDRVAARDVDGALTYVCAAQREAVRAQLNPAGAMASQLPGVDPNAILGALTFDTSGMTVTQDSVNGDEATVKLGGSLKISVDEAKLTAALAPAASQLPGGADVGQLVQMFVAFTAQPIPVDETTRVIREEGAWRVCDADFSIG